MRVNRVVGSVHDLNGRGKRVGVARGGQLNLDNRVGDGCRIGIVSDKERHVNAETKVFLDVAHHIGGSVPGDAGLIAHGGIVVGTNGQVNERQAHNVPFVEVGFGSGERFAVNAGQHTDVAVGNNVTSCEHALLVLNVVGVVEHLVIVFKPLVDIVVDIVFGHLANKGINARATDDVEHFGIGVRAHHRVHIGKELHTGVPRDLNGVGRDGVVQLILEHLRFARFKGGLSMDIYEDWAIHMEDIGGSFIAGSLGGLKFLDVDQTGGPMAVPAGGQIVGGGNLQKPRLVYYGVDSEAKLFETKLDCAIGDVTGQQELLIHPEMAMYNDNQLQWYSYLWGDLTDETRIDSPYIAMQTAFLSEGVVLSSELGRSVTADEIKAMAKSIALREQETEFGTITYDFDDYKA